MPRYFFNLARGDLLLRDHVGIELPDLDAVRSRAVQELERVLKSERVGPQENIVLEIRDTAGKLLTSVEKTLPELTKASEIFVQEHRLVDDLAKWLEEQRAEVLRQASRGEDTASAERILEAVSRLVAEHLATRIRDAAQSNDRSEPIH